MWGGGKGRVVAMRTSNKVIMGRSDICRRDQEKGGTMRRDEVRMRSDTREQ